MIAMLLLFWAVYYLLHVGFELILGTMDLVMRSVYAMLFWTVFLALVTCMVVAYS